MCADPVAHEVYFVTDPRGKWGDHFVDERHHCQLPMQEVGEHSITRLLPRLGGASRTCDFGYVLSGRTSTTEDVRDVAHLSVVRQRSK